MLTTAELRWFYNATLPQPVTDWFTDHCPGEQLAPPVQRQDLYLATPGCEYLGIKLRQNQLEIKWRQAELGVVQLVNGLAGQAEQWIKWICEPTPEKSLPEADLAKDCWIGVSKIRSQRKYQFLAAGSVIAVPIDQPINTGCTVELTKLSVHENAWWSLAFEAFGEDKASTDALQVVANHLLSNYQEPMLQAQDSYGYPQWLSTASPDPLSQG